jgi:hypothetical protein
MAKETQQQGPPQSAVEPIVICTIRKAVSYGGIYLAPRMDGTRLIPLADVPLPREFAERFTPGAVEITGESEMTANELPEALKKAVAAMEASAKPKG